MRSRCQRLEELFCKDEHERQRLAYRWSALDRQNRSRVASFQGYVRFLFLSGKGSWSLTFVLARFIGDLSRTVSESAQSKQI